MSTGAASDEHWRSILTPEEFVVLRLKGTEPAGSGVHNDQFPATGRYVCRACQSPLYSAASKFRSSCGWPAFSRCYVGAIRCEPDLDNFEASGGRVEILCGHCGGHLGHVFMNESSTCDERHCVNSLSLSFQGEGSDKETPSEEESLRAAYDDAMRRAIGMLMGNVGNAP